MSKYTKIDGKVYDLERLQEEALRFDNKYHYQSGVGKPWQGLPLRNPNASVKRDGIAIGVALKCRGEEGMKPCLDTDYMKDLPYMSEILGEFAELGVVFLVRLLKLLPGNNIKPHCDGRVFSRTEGKIARFHIPIITDPGIIMIWTEGPRRRPTKRQEVHLEAGQLYYTDVSDIHWVENPTENVERVHLVIDVELSEAVQTWLAENHEKQTLAKGQEIID